MHAYDLSATTKDEAEIQDKNNPHFVSPDEFSPVTTVVVQDLTDTSLTSLSSSHYTQQPETQPIDDTSQQIAETSDSTALHELFNLTKWVDLPDFVPPKKQRKFLELFSGPNHPLSSHIRSLGVDVLKPFDILLDPSLDILDDQCYYMIVRVVASRQIGSVVAAPPCTEYSLLKLKQPGPLPCRLPDHLEEPLYDTPECRYRFYSSREILQRSIVVLHVNHIHGGYSGLEQPLHAMSWNEKFVMEARSNFLMESAIFSHCRIVDDPTEALNKHWLFVTNMPGFHQAELQCTCDCQHSSFAGRRNSDGEFQSKGTAEYPQHLVQHISKFFRLEKAINHPTDFVEWSSIFVDLPKSPPAKLRHIPDGGGLVSSALWPLPFKCDIFFDLRKKLEQISISHNLPRSLPKHIQQGDSSFPFPHEVMTATEDAFRSFFSDVDISFDIPEGQPFRLEALRRLALMMDDPDADLIPHLISGVDLGVTSLIPSSHTWPEKIPQLVSTHDPDFQVFSENWHSAEADENTLKTLIQKEIEDGFVREIGSLEQAKNIFGDLLAIGKLGIASQQPDKPRLVLDSTISGLNPISQHAIQEKCSYPKLHDLRNCVSPGTRHPYKFLNLDIKSAHKRIKVRKEHQGLLAFMFQDKVYHYQVLHFGGTCSAYYWTRLAAIFLRFFHHFLYVHHFALVFVDDFIFGLDPVAAPLQTSTSLLCCAFLNIPLSWHKLELGYRITWIGWSIDSWSDTISLPCDKLQKLLRNLFSLTCMGKYRRSDVEAVAGHLLWISDMFPMIRSTLGHVYKILSRPGIQLLRLNKEQIEQVLTSLDANGRLTRFIQQPYIPQGSVISRLGKVQFYSGQLQQFSASCFDLSFAWASFWNTRSNRVQILEDEAAILKQLYNEILEQIPRVPLSLHRRWNLQAGADAFATETKFGIGAWITLPNQSEI